MPENRSVNGLDLQCFGPFDDEASYATGIPGDNKGAKGNIECPFDGNSGPGNDGVCCNLQNPSQNVTPNGCDSHGCCEIDVNGNLSGEHVYVSGACSFAPACGGAGTLGCACDSSAGCDAASLSRASAAARFFSADGSGGTAAASRATTSPARKTITL